MGEKSRRDGPLVKSGNYDLDAIIKQKAIAHINRLSEFATWTNELNVSETDSHRRDNRYSMFPEMSFTV